MFAIFRPRLRTTAIALGASLAAATVRHVCTAYFSILAPLLILHVAAVAIAAQYLGTIAGLVTTTASFGLVVYQLDPRPDLATLICFLVLGVALSYFGGKRQRMARELQAAQERLAIKHEVGRMGTFEWFVREDKVRWSPEMEKLYGIESVDHQHTFEEWKAHVHPDDLDSTVSAMERAMRNRQATLNSTYRIIGPDGSDRWIHSRGKFEYDAAGQPVRLLGINLDVTEQKRAEEALKSNSRTMRLALEAANSGGWVWNLKSGEIFWTDTYYRLLGVDPAVRVTPDLLYSLVHPDDLKRLKKDVDDAVQGRVQEFRSEFRVLKPDGGVRWLERRGRVFCDSDGKPVQIVGISTDITEQKILRGLLPTCAQCKKIRDEHDQWHALEKYITEHSDARFSHGLCPDCLQQYANACGFESVV